MTAPHSAPRRPQVRFAPSFRLPVLAALALALGGCQATVNLPSLRELFARDTGGGQTTSTGPAPFVDPDGVPSAEVNTPALAALTAAATAATTAALAAEEITLAATTTAAFIQTLDAKAAPSLVAHAQLEDQIIVALIGGILSGLDGPPGLSPRAATVPPAVIAAAGAAGYHFDHQRAATTITTTIATKRPIWVLRELERAVRADPATAAAQLTAAIQRTPAQAVALLNAALDAAPAELPAIAAAATAATQGTDQAAAVAAAVSQANRDGLRRKFKDALRATPADAAHLLAEAIRQTPDQIFDRLTSALDAVPQQAPAILSAAIEALPAGVRSANAALLTGFTMSRVPTQADAIRSAALQTAAQLGLPAATLEALRAPSLAQISSATAGNAATTGPSISTPTQLPQTVAPTASTPVATPGGGAPEGKLDFSFILRNREYALVKVLYGTERKQAMPYAKWVEEFSKASDSTAVEFYAREREDQRSDFHYGRAYVSIPAGTNDNPVHQMGKIERPRIFESENIKLHFMLRGLTELDQSTFEKDIANLTLPNTTHPNGKDAFIFIHGFNVNFNEAVMRAAQMAYDFRFLGAPVVYSWASRRSAMITGMQHDQDVNTATVDKLMEFVEIVQKQTAGTLHVVAHSMGNRALVVALKQLAKLARELKNRGHNFEWRPGRTKLFGEIVLAAPDVSKFLLEPKDAEAILEIADRITLYVSDDRALAFARLFSGIKRIGEAGSGMFRSAAVETVNATGADQSFVGLHHSYPFEVQSVLADLRAVIVERAKPDSASRRLIRDAATESWNLITPKR
jgi:esterase/lipase superfamily enzyme